MKKEEILHLKSINNIGISENLSEKDEKDEKEMLKEEIKNLKNMLKEKNEKNKIFNYSINIEYDKIVDQISNQIFKNIEKKL